MCKNKSCGYLNAVISMKKNADDRRPYRCYIPEQEINISERECTATKIKVT